MHEAKKSQDGQPSRHFDTRLPEYTIWRRMQIPLIAAGVSAGVRLIGPTLSFEVLGKLDADWGRPAARRFIWTFWHRGIFGILWYARKRGIVVLHSTNFDGQWIGRVIKRFGFGAALGSSTRGGLQGLEVMAQAAKDGHDVAFTIDGPRGPRFVAKPGPVMLARQVGCPIGVFNIGYERAKIFQKTWDQFELPRLFTRVIIVVAPPIEVPTDATREIIEAKHAEMQRELDRTQQQADSWFTLTEAEKARERERWNK